MKNLIRNISSILKEKAKKIDENNTKTPWEKTGESVDQWARRIASEVIAEEEHKKEENKKYSQKAWLEAEIDQLEDMISNMDRQDEIELIGFKSRLQELRQEYDDLMRNELANKKNNDEGDS